MPTQSDLVPQRDMGKSHIHVRSALARVDQSMARMAVAYGLQCCGLDVIARSFVRLEQAVEWVLGQEERYLRSLVRKTDDECGFQPACDGDELGQRAANMETITRELDFLRLETHDFDARHEVCRSYQTLMKQLEELESVLNRLVA